MDSKIRIMVVEDDASLAREIGLALEKWQYEAVVAEGFDDILQEFARIRPQLVLIDINLPGRDGFYWCSRIRRISKVPVIYISSRNDDQDKIMAIAQGGDDYVEKPFRMELLHAKIEAMLRRTYEYKVRERIFLTAGLCFDCAGQSLYYAMQYSSAAYVEEPSGANGQTGEAGEEEVDLTKSERRLFARSNGQTGEVSEKEIDLTKSERRLFARLVENRPDVVTRDELMMALWDTDEYVTDAALTTIISRLRAKLKSVCGEDVVCTRKGQGYYVK